MKVLHVINQMWHSGAETSLRQILTEMQDPTIVHDVLSLDHERNDFDALRTAGISCGRPRAPLRSRAARIGFVARAISERRPDLVHTTLFEADLAGRVAAKYARVPTLISLVNMRPPRAVDQAPGGMKLHSAHLIDGLLARHATTHFHAITSAVADEASQALKIERERIQVIPRGRSLAALGGPPTQERRVQARKRLGFEHERIVLHIGRQEPQKGHLNLLKAFDDVANVHDDVVLLLAGRDGNATPAIIQATAESQHGKRIHRLGQRDDVGDLLCAADLFVFPSLWEGLGGAVLEAMAMQTPIIASDIPAVSEVLGRGTCGLLVDPANASALSATMLLSLQDPSVLDPLIEHASRRYLSHYSIQSCTRAMRHMYQQMAPQPTPTKPPNGALALMWRRLHSSREDRQSPLPSRSSRRSVT